MKRIADNIRSAFSTLYNRPHRNADRQLKKMNRTPSHDEDSMDKRGAADSGRFTYRSC